MESEREGGVGGQENEDRKTDGVKASTGAGGLIGAQKIKRLFWVVWGWDGVTFLLQSLVVAVDSCMLGASSDALRASERGHVDDRAGVQLPVGVKDAVGQDEAALSVCVVDLHGFTRQESLYGEEKRGEERRGEESK